MATSKTPKGGPSDEERRQAQAFLRVFERQRPDGTYHFSDHDVRAFVPLLVLGGGHLPEDASPELGSLLNGFFAQIGVDATTTPEQLQRLVDKHYRTTPVNAELLEAFKEALNADLAGETERRGKAAGRLITGAQPDSNIPVAQRPAPKGAVKAAMWRLNADALPLPSKGAQAPKKERTAASGRKKR